MLLVKELKKVICSVSYLLFVAILFLGLYSQGVFHFGDRAVEEPRPGQNYGVRNEEIPEVIMPAALESLWQEYTQNVYTTYPIGFYKTVRLNDAEKEEMVQILARLTGLEKEKILEAGEDIPALKEGFSYTEFKECMDAADKLLGGGSDYVLDALIGFGTKDITYEEAKVEYQLVRDKDRFTGGYARLFCDYAGVMVLSVLPVFLAVVLCLKDRRAKMTELIYSRSISSGKIIWVRYAAILAAVMLPVILLSYYSNMEVWGLYRGMKLDYLAALKYDLGWLMPTVMVTVSLGMFLTELTGTPIAAAVQCLWWFVDINAGYKSVQSSYALLRLAPRHNAGENSRFRITDFLENFNRLAQNRLLMAGLALLLVCLTVCVYEWRRRGIIGGRKKFRVVLADIFYRKNEHTS